MTPRCLEFCALVTLVLGVGLGCSSASGDKPAPKPVALPQGAQVFRYGIDPKQTISAAPFPNDLYRGADGVTLAPLASDSTYATLATPESLGALDAVIKGRPGFGFAQPIQLFATEEIDLASVTGHVHLVAVDGPEKGREVALETWWSPLAKALSFFPAPGEWIMPDSTYVLVVNAGVKSKSGKVIGAPLELGDVLISEPVNPAAVTAWERAAPLRGWLAAGNEVPVIATAFRVEPSLAPLAAMLATIAATKLDAPTRALRYDAKAGKMIDGASYQGAELDGFFGVPAPPFDKNPGSWDGGDRERASAISGKPYAAGSFRGHIGKVALGSMVVPSFNMISKGNLPKVAPLSIVNGVAETKLKAMVPITLYLCENHLKSAANLPIAIFNHGGTATRNNATALAIMNCQVGIATLAADLPFHGGRSETALVGDKVVPIRADVQSDLTGLNQGDPGFVADGVGDEAGADATVGNLFGLNVRLAPDVIEANLLTVPAELAALVKLVREGDWSAFHPGISFDGKAIFLEGLSFGTTFTTGFLALSDDWRGAIGSTGSGHSLRANPTVAPSNGDLASQVIQGVLGLKSTAEELQLGAYRDPVGGLYSWLAERGDSMAFAPYVLRHRKTKSARNIVHTGDSWDETLSSPAQLRYNAALGLEVLTSDGWKLDATVPGAAGVKAKAAAAKTSANVTFDGVTHTAAIFYNAESCHPQLITPLCAKTFKKEYPPIVALAAKDVKVTVAPICAIHAQGIALFQPLLGGTGPGPIVPPSGDCATVYGK